jgi:4-hydroxy-tetrahydrodipicolinate synthase
MKPLWSGVFPAITTQMHRDGSLDLDATARHAEVLIDSGVN